MAARIAVIGSGVAGLAAAWLLSRNHDVTLYEAEDRLGGHSHTHVIDLGDGPFAVDSGYIVYNEHTYPNLTALYAHLGVATAPSSMSFALSADDGAYEYCGAGLNGLYAQRGNLLSPRHHLLVADLLRFFRVAPGDLESGRALGRSLGDYLKGRGFSQAFTDYHIAPMAAAIWSTPDADVLAFPAASFLRFFANHGLLQTKGRPQWRTVVGGSHAYVERLAGDLRSRGATLRLGAPVTRIEPLSRSSAYAPSSAVGTDAVAVHAGGDNQSFDHVVIAAHPDQALRMLSVDPHAGRGAYPGANAGDGGAVEGLAACTYTSNTAVLHTDPAQMPQRRAVWSSWNYLMAGPASHAGAGTEQRLATEDAQGQQGGSGDVSLTYWMNSLQPLPTAHDVFVTLNPVTPIASEHELARMAYAHPLFNEGIGSAQARVWEAQGVGNTWYCGAWLGYGFHEDGLQSGLAVAEAVHATIAGPASADGRDGLRPWAQDQDAAHALNARLLIEQAGPPRALASGATGAMASVRTAVPDQRQSAELV
ncbi:MAG: FAD-dependent oxidoreductase [Pseudomonadota bacterium]